MKTSQKRKAESGKRKADSVRAASVDNLTRPPTGVPVGLNSTMGTMAVGSGVSEAQMVRKSNAWRDNYNPLVGLKMRQLVTWFEMAERGSFVEVQLLLRKAEKRYPVLKGFVERLVSSLTELPWDIQPLKVRPPGATAAMVAAQQTFLRQRYDAIRNLRAAIGQIALADIRGYTILQKHRYDGGPFDGAIEELYWLEPWVWSRDGYYGDFYYNELSRFGVGLGVCAGFLGEANRLGSTALPREDFVIREVESPLYEIALIAFQNWLLGRKDWAAFVEVFGLAKGVVIMPENVAEGRENEYQAAAERVSEGVSGALPAGSDIKFPTSGVRGTAPFRMFCDAQDEDVVLAATSGLLSMLTTGGGGLNHGPHQEHADVWQKIAHMKGHCVNEVFRRDIDRLELAAEFPGQPVCVQFTLAVQDAEEVSAVADTVVKLESVGLQTEAREISERTGFKLTRVAVAGGASELGSPGDVLRVADPRSGNSGRGAVSRAVKNRQTMTGNADDACPGARLCEPQHADTEGASEVISQAGFAGDGLRVADPRSEKVGRRPVDFPEEEGDLLRDHSVT